jgi:hypothetical protein
MTSILPRIQTKRGRPFLVHAPSTYLRMQPWCAPLASDTRGRIRLPFSISSITIAAKRAVVLHELSMYMHIPFIIRQPTHERIFERFPI